MERSDRTGKTGGEGGASSNTIGGLRKKKTEKTRPEAEKKRCLRAQRKGGEAERNVRIACREKNILSQLVGTRKKTEKSGEGEHIASRKIHGLLMRGEECISMLQRYERKLKEKRLQRRRGGGEY